MTSRYLVVRRFWARSGSHSMHSTVPPFIVWAIGFHVFKINPAVRHQTFEGWGTSLAWWAYQIGGWATAKKNQFADLLVDPVNGDSPGGSGCTSMPATAGYPHITVPAGYVFGLPVGISFFSTAWQESNLIKFAYAFEQATQYRRQPRYLPTANLNL